MTFDSFYQLINNGIPSEALGGISSAIIIDLFNRAKGYFKGSEPTPQEYAALLNNKEFKETMDRLAAELGKNQMVINQADKIEIKNQINDAIFNQKVTFE